MGSMAVSALVLTGACTETPKPSSTTPPAKASKTQTTKKSTETTPPPPAPQPAHKVVLNEQAKRGKTSFAMCAACHGQNAEGVVGMGPTLASSTFLAASTDAYLKETIQKGRPGTTMIPWGASLKDNQIDDIIAYLRALAPHEPATLDESPLKGNVKLGGEVYKGICQACHGVTGAGYAETKNGTGIGRKGFLDTSSNGFIRYLIGEGKTGTKMRGFRKGKPHNIADLTPDEVDSVIQYLRKNAK